MCVCVCVCACINQVCARLLEIAHERGDGLQQASEDIIAMNSKEEREREEMFGLH